MFNSKIIFFFFALLCSGTSNAQWVQIGNAIVGEESYNYSGSSVCMNSEGTIIGIGSPEKDNLEAEGINHGQVRIFQNINGSWDQMGNSLIGEISKAGFGSSININADGNIIAIGAPSISQIASYSGLVKVFEYDDNEEEWIQLGDDIIGENLFDEFGYSVSINSDGNIVAIGAPGNNGDSHNTGHVRIFELINNNWSQIGTDINGEYLVYSGTGVSLSDDGMTVAVGAKFLDGLLEADTINDNRGGVGVYHFNGSDWEEIGDKILGLQPDDQMGKVLSISSDGAIIAIGSPDYYNSAESYRGNVQVFQNIMNEWVSLGQPIFGTEGVFNFGTSIDISGDGTIISVGSQGLFSPVHIYIFDGEQWQKGSYDIPNEEDIDSFGFSIALNTSGTRLVSGAPEYTTYSPFVSNGGQVKVFEYLNVNIENLEKNKTSPIEIFPNPTHGLLNIQGENINEIEILDITGKVKNQLSTNTDQTSINLSAYSRGVYFIKITTDSNIETQKIILE